MKTLFYLKHAPATVVLFLFCVLSNFSYAQEKPKQVKIEKGRKVNMKELEEKEIPDSLKRKGQVGPEENIKFKPTPIPRDAKKKRTDIKPGYQKIDKTPKTRIDSSYTPLIPGGNGSGYGLIRPPDMGGAVGNSFLVEAINTEIICFDKTGTVLTRVDLRSFFQDLIPSFDISTFIFDPRVLYDEVSERWLITASAFTAVALAISDNSDPTSTWQGYSFDVDAADDSWLDFPTFGLNKNWIAIAGNLVPLGISISAVTNAANCQITTTTPHGFDTGDRIQINGVSGMTELNGVTYAITVIDASNFYLNVNSTAFGVYTSDGIGRNVTNTNTTDLFVMDKAALYAGSSSTATLYNPGGHTLFPAKVCDNSTNDLPILYTATGYSVSGQGVLGYYDITGTPVSPVLSSPQFIEVTSTWADGSWPNQGPQLGSTIQISTGDPRLAQVVLRNGSLWCAHTIFLPLPTTTPPTHSAVQWWQIDPATLTVLQLGRIEDATATEHYAYPSIDVNAYNDVVVGFSRFTPTQYGGCNFAYHLHTDPPGTMNPVIEYRAGLAKYDLGRWGDYSSTATDPDLFTIWTLQEYAENPIPFEGASADQWGTEWNQVILPIPELYSKDRDEDNGAEPNPSVLPMWQSQDIWLRQSRDVTHTFAHMHQDAEYRTDPRNPNYVYVEVHNRGGAPTLGTERLSLYWAKAGSGLGWPSSWNGSYYFDSPANTMLMGAPIGGTVPIPAMMPGTSTILEFPWMPPFPDSYSLPFLIGDRNHFCLLARITTSSAAPYGMTSPETADLYQNVQRNNNIVWSNIEVYNLSAIDAAEYMVVGNTTNEVMNAKIRFEALDQNGAAGFLKNGKLIVTAEGKLKKMFRKNPPTGRGIFANPNGSFSVLEDGAVLDNVILQPNDFGRLIMKFISKDPKVVGKGFAINVTQLATKNGSDRIIGGQTYVFGQVTGFGTSPKTNSQTSTENKK